MLLATKYTLSGDSMGKFKVSVYICYEQNTMDFKIGDAVYPIGFLESVGVHLVPEYLRLLASGVFVAIGEDLEDAPRGVFKGEWEIDSPFDLTKRIG